MRITWEALTWTLGALIGAVAAVLNMIDARADRQALPQDDGRRLRAVAANTLRSESLRIVVQVAFATVGLLVMLAPLSLAGLVGLVTKVALIGAAWVLALQTVLDFRFRRRQRREE